MQRAKYKKKKKLAKRKMLNIMQKQFNLSDEDKL